MVTVQINIHYVQQSPTPSYTHDNDQDFDLNQNVRSKVRRGRRVYVYPNVY